MKVFTLITFIFFSFLSLAGKPYKIEATVVDQLTTQPLEDVKVDFISSDNRILFTSLTDERGVAVYEDCTEKTLTIRATKENSDFQMATYYYSSKHEVGFPVIIEVVNFNSYREKIKEYSKAATIDSASISSPKQCEGLINASYPGGMSEMAKYLQKTIRYPERALDEGISGKCYVKFYVDENGVISNITVFKGIPDCPDCDLEAIKAVAGMPNWMPAVCNGNKVTTIYSLPIKFQAM